MTFTDDNLKRLKEFRHSDDGDCMGCVPCVDIAALLARLEAAEKLANYHECQDDLSTCPHLEAWRKAAGK